MVEMLEGGPPLDAALLVPVVRAALGEPGASVGAWRVESLGYRLINGITGGLWRVRGAARVGGRSVSWSVVLKVLRRVGVGVAANFAPTEEPDHWNYWRREPLAYASPYLADLAPGLVAPRCYGTAEPEADTIWLWLEDIAGLPASAWPVARWGLAARHLGRWQGAYAAGQRTLPAAPWLCRGHLRAWVPREPGVALDAVCEPGAWAHPLLRDHVAADTGERVMRLWARRDALLAHALRGTPIPCHLDLWSSNLLARHIPGDDEDGDGTARGLGETVLLDWSMFGIGVIGEDVANLVLDSVWMFGADGRDLPTFERTILDGYLAGLRDAGWTGDDATLRAAYAAVGALRFGLLAGSVLALARHEDQYAAMEARYKLPIAEVVARRAAVVRRALELGE